MANDPMRQFINLPAELLAAMGQLKEAGKGLREEIKDIRAQIKEAKKEGRDVTDLQGRLESLQDKSDQVKGQIQKQRDMKAQARAGSGFQQAQSLMYKIGSIAMGRVSVGDVGAGAGSLKSYLTRKAVGAKDLGFANDLARAASVAGGVEGAAAAVAGPAAVLIGAAYTVSSIVQGEEARRMVRAKVDQDIAQNLFDIFRASTFGGSEFSAEDMENLRKQGQKAGKEAADAATYSSWSRVVYKLVGATDSEKSSQLRERFSKLPAEMERARRRYGTIADDQVRAQLEGDRKAQAAKLLASQEALGRVASTIDALNPISRAFEELGFKRRGLFDIYNWYRSGELEKEAELQAVQRFKNTTADRDAEMKRFAEDPAFDVARVLALNTREQIRAVERDRWTRTQQWGMM